MTLDNVARIPNQLHESLTRLAAEAEPEFAALSSLVGEKLPHLWESLPFAQLPIWSALLSRLPGKRQQQVEGLAVLLEGIAQWVIDRTPEQLLDLTPLPGGGGEPRPGSWNLAAITGVLLSAGPLHFLVPKPFDTIVPPSLPGPARLWTYLSGVAEVVIGALLVIPRTRRLGGLAAASLFAAVFPANIHMAQTWGRRGPVEKAIAYGRLPLQLPLIGGALKIALTGK